MRSPLAVAVRACLIAAVDAFLDAAPVIRMTLYAVAVFSGIAGVILWTT